MTARGALLPLAALLGLGVAVVAVVHDSQTPPVPSPARTPASPPWDSFVAGTGLVEPSSGDITIGSPVPGVVTEIPVRVGDHVAAGDVLFRVDDRDLRAQLVTARAGVAAAMAALEVPQHRLDYARDLALRAPSAQSAQNLTELRDEAKLAAAKLELAEAQVSQLELELERHTVRAPVAGRVLQLRLRLGESVDSSGSAPALLFGDDRTLYLRAEIDESEAWRVRPDAKAVAAVRGDPDSRIPLHFEYVEPEMVPKRSLTGNGSERTDTRVLQVLYSFSPGELPIYVGEQLDVFVEAPPVGDGEVDGEP